MWKTSSKTKSVQEDQERLFFALERLVSVAKAKIEREDNESVKEIVEDLVEIFKKFWQLQIQNPAKFHSLLWSKSFYEDYWLPLTKKDVSAEGPETSKNREQLELDAALRLTFRAEREREGLSRFLYSFKKIWKYASNYKNEEISKYVVYQLIWLLEDLTQKPKNDAFVKEFLNLVLSLAVEAMEKADAHKRIDTSVYSSSVEWYISIVFNTPRMRRDGFHLSYLPLFDTALFQMAQYVVSNDQKSIFDHIVSLMISGIMVHEDGKIWEYGTSLFQTDAALATKIEREHKIQERINRLAASEKNLFSKLEVDQWIEEFNQITKVLQPHFDGKQKEEACKLEKEIVDVAISQFKLMNLLEIVFAIGSYCLFKNKPEYVKFLWEAKQPPDSDANWIGHDILPVGLNNILSLYFKKGPWERKINFWEGHHGTTKYYKQYFLLLVARALRNIAKDANGEYPEIVKYEVPFSEVTLLSEVEHSIDDLVQSAQELEKNTDLLNALGFKSEEIQGLFEERLIPFLKATKRSAQNRIEKAEIKQSISPKKVEEFKLRVIDTFRENAVVRDILQYSNCYEDKTGEVHEEKKSRFGVNVVDQKAVFFEKWHVFFPDWGESYGKSLAISENTYVINELRKGLTEISDEQFEKTLEELEHPSNAIILAINGGSYRFLKRTSQKFKPKWQKGTPELNVKGFSGWYELKGEPIPVFEAFLGGDFTTSILILDKTKLGRWIQYSPLNQGEKKELVKGVFYMDVQPFSENAELIKNFVAKPPDWLKAQGEEEKQKLYLQKSALINIFEKFEYQTSCDAKGYLLRIRL